jgi:serine/threonine-protein kinase
MMEPFVVLRSLPHSRENCFRQGKGSMPPKVILKVVQGDNAGEEFVFDERTTCILGRSKGCFPRLVDRKNHRKISRHHCLLDITPPSISVRDFGSKNGTFVNGELIGKRQKHQTPDEAARQLPPVRELASGDEMRIQNTILRVSTRVPTLCRDCSVEIPHFELKLARVAPGVHLCGTCRERPKDLSRRVPMQMPTVVCTSCGRNVSPGAAETHGGIHICDACKLEPLKLARALIHAAEQGAKELSALRGYSVIRQLGGGSMAAVFQAKEHRTGKKVALKLLIP